MLYHNMLLCNRQTLNNADLRKVIRECYAFHKQLHCIQKAIDPSVMIILDSSDEQENDISASSSQQDVSLHHKVYL